LPRGGSDVRDCDGKVFDCTSVASAAGGFKPRGQGKSHFAELVGAFALLRLRFTQNKAEASSRPSSPSLLEEAWSPDTASATPSDPSMASAS